MYCVRSRPTFKVVFIVVHTAPGVLLTYKAEAGSQQSLNNSTGEPLAVTAGVKVREFMSESVHDGTLQTGYRKRCYRPGEGTASPGATERDSVCSYTKTKREANAGR